MRRLSFHSLVALCSLMPVVSGAQEFVQTGRYTAVMSSPTEAQKNPLNEIVIVRFPDTVMTVGDALRELVAGTGYALSDTVYSDSEVFGLLGRPLPDIQRTLGPMTISVGLETLAGGAFRMIVDPVHRLVAFELDPGLRTVEIGVDSETQDPK